MLTVVRCVGQQDRRRIGRDAETRPDLILALGLEVARVAEDGEVGPGNEREKVVMSLIGPTMGD